MNCKSRSYSTPAVAESSSDFTQESQAEHLIRLKDGKWAIWRWTAIRGAGFPASDVLKLAAPECARAADHLIRVEEDLKQARKVALDALKSALKDESDAEKRAYLKKALARVKEHKPAPLTDHSSDWSAALDAYDRAYAVFDSGRDGFDKEFEKGVNQMAEAIYGIASDAHFIEALLWQNRRIVHKGIRSFLKDKPRDVARTHIRRRNEEMIASYIQRYCVKNDSIGFFGPVGWAKFVHEGEAIVVRPGSELVGSRDVFLEGWCIDVLAETLGESKALRPWLAPRLLPFFHIIGTTLYKPPGPSVSVSPQTASVIGACDGLRMASEIASELTSASSEMTEAEVYAILEHLYSEGLILWSLECPIDSPPEQTLRHLLERIGDSDLRAGTLAVFSEIEKARIAVGSSAGDAKALDKALGMLEETFTRLTGADSTRHTGEMYAGRTLIYEDCRRDLDMEIGPDIVEALSPALSLLLTSARWITSETAEIYRRVFRETYEELIELTGSATVDCLSFWQKSRHLLVNGKALLLEPLVEDFQRRWSRILPAASGQRQIQCSSEELHPEVLAAFDAPRSGWRTGIYHSPDIMIAAKDVDAIRRGDYKFVMGELHLGLNTLRTPVFLGQHPSPAEMFQAIESDLPEACIIPITSKHWSATSSRSVTALVPKKDFRLAVSYDALNSDPSRVLPIGALVVEDSQSGLVVRTRDGRLCFDLIEVFGEFLSQEVVSLFQVLAPKGNTPRLTIDNLVVCREAWRWLPGEMEFAQEKTESARFLATRRWARSRGLPRFVFVKPPMERKPLYLDFDSPVLINLFARMVCRSLDSNFADQPISLTEMLPDTEQVWLPDAEGRCYTSEFRIIAVDTAS